MSPSETEKVKTIAQMEQQIQALEEQIDIKKICTDSQQQASAAGQDSRYKDYSPFASLFSFALEQTIG